MKELSPELLSCASTSTATAERECVAANSLMTMTAQTKYTKLRTRTALKCFPRMRKEKAAVAKDSPGDD